MTKPQWISFQQVLERHGEPVWHGWAGFGSDSYYWVKYDGLGIGIETDGYAHS